MLDSNQRWIGCKPIELATILIALTLQKLVEVGRVELPSGMKVTTASTCVSGFEVQQLKGASVSRRCPPCSLGLQTDSFRRMLPTVFCLGKSRTVVFARRYSYAKLCLVPDIKTISPGSY